MIHIRPAVATDIPRLVTLDHTSTSDYVWQLDLRREADQVGAGFREIRLPRTVDLFYPRSPEALKDDWTHRDLTLIALEENKLVGYACAREDRPSGLAWITDLVAAPDQRRKGVATALVDAVQSWWLERGDRRLILEMQSKNHACIRFAQKSGFDFCGYNDRYYATMDVALFFAKTIK